MVFGQQRWKGKEEEKGLEEVEREDEEVAR